MKRRGIRYIPCNAGLFIFVRLAPKAQEWHDEARFVEILSEAGISVSPGRTYSVPEWEKGWVRIGFALPKERLLEAIRRMDLAM